LGYCFNILKYVHDVLADALPENEPDTQDRAWLRRYILVESVMVVGFKRG
jgi:hypothetical protein